MADEDDELEAEDDIEAESDDEIGDDLSDDFDDTAAVDDDESVDDDSVDDEEEAEAEATIKPKTRGVTRKKRKETEALHTVAAREDLRKQLANDVEAFLKRGGSIKAVAQDERADPPKKPESNYGRGSI